MMMSLAALSAQLGVAPSDAPVAGRPGGSGSFFLLFAFSALLPFWALPFWDCCLFRLPPPPAACSARPAGVALSISHLYPAPTKHKWRHGNAARRHFLSLEVRL